MTDELDRAAEYEELARQDALNTSRRSSGPEATGVCLWCEEPVAERVRWCCAECRDEYDAHQAASKRRFGVS